MISEDERQAWRLKHAARVERVDWAALPTTEDPFLVLEAALAIFDPVDNEHLDGYGPGEIDVILAARRLVDKHRPVIETQLQF